MPVAKKSAVKKPALPSDLPTLTFEGEFAKETQGTFQYKETGEREDQVSGGIYLKKPALPEGVIPTKVRVTIEVLEAE
jgi:hypothetical protein